MGSNPATGYISMMNRAVLGLSACTLTACWLLGASACMTFADDTRKPIPSDGAAAGAQPGADSSPADGATSRLCTMTASATAGIGVCGGLGGGELTSSHVEVEPKHAPPGEPLATDEPVCGSTSSGDVDVYTYSAGQGDCLFVSMQALAGSVRVQGLGIDQTGGPSEDFGLPSPRSSGPLTLTVSGTNGGYKLVVRR